jgi:hypothetical protein
MLTSRQSDVGPRPSLHLRLYRLRKSFALFPGGRTAIAPDFLSAHYRWRTGKRAPVRRALDRLIGRLFALWVGPRAHRVARRHRLGPDWVRSAISLARARMIDPNDLALFGIDSADEARTYLRRYEYAAINKLLNPAGWSNTCALTDKARFAERCAAAGLPHAETLGEVTGGQVRVRRLPDGFWLAAKMTDGDGGAGFRTFALDRRPESDEEFVASIRTLKLKRGARWLIQPRLRNHPDLAVLGLDALLTVRLTTILDERGDPELVTSVLRLPRDPSSPVDNIKRGGLMAPVDPDTGRLGLARAGRGLGEFEVHPETGVRIEGIALPGWPAARAQVARAHQAFPEYVMIGWDVALTPDGPVLIEGNGKPCIIVAQRGHGTGIGATRFGHLIAHHLERLGYA